MQQDQRLMRNDGVRSSPRLLSTTCACWGAPPARRSPLERIIEWLLYVQVMIIDPKARGSFVVT
jgi:hypothetical protein